MSPRRLSLIVVAISLFGALLVACVMPPTEPTPSVPTPTVVPLPVAQATAMYSPTAAPPTIAPSPASLPSPTPTVTPSPATPTASPMATGVASPVATTEAARPEDTIRQAADAVRPLRDVADLAVRLKGVSPAAATPAAPANDLDLQVGRKDVFWVSDQKAKSYFQMAATIAYVTPHAYFYIQDGERVSPAAVRQAAEAFEQQIYPLVRRYFGSEGSGPNGDSRVTILNGRIPNVGGYFSSDDQYPRSVSPNSNERNIIYINTNSYPVGTRDYNATVAHELQHLVSWFVDRDAETWFNEGSSEFAMQLAGYDPGGAVNAYAANTNTQLTAWSQDDAKTYAHYGAGYLFLNYFAEHYGGYDRLPDLYAQPGRGVATFDNYLKSNGYNAGFDDVFRDWVIANYLDDESLSDGRYGYRDVSIRARTESVNAFPFRRTVSIEQYAAKYYDVSAGAGDVTIEIVGSTTSKLLNNEARSGRRQWWSNRGDLMNTKLTREFDLSGLAKATLRFAAWYDIEDRFDYAYVEVSIDGGKTWSTLATSNTTTDNPLGQNMGSGYTGKSGGGDEPGWVQEDIDLSSFAGKKILLRFEHVTDDAYNAPGFAVDDIAIPELGFFDDAESDTGWQAVGFVRTANVIPQSFALQLITAGQATKVESIPVGADGRATFTTRGLGTNIKSAVLVIAPMAKVTTEPAQVQLSVVPTR